MYVKWFDTVMFYYVILENLVNVTFCHSNFLLVPSPVPKSQGMEPRRQMLASAGGQYRGHCRRDIAGAQDKVREEQIPELSRMVSSSVARGYRFCYTREYRQGG
ncbi:unnamed protein product [Staurois parvus]|uniref:Uncharacterized protein n=1 Tax=Staurois parvus TaxID=386267 RepID=A0ABN9F3K4_9NEOB|nr:unnamed protein product [Staurois parvus]